MTTNFNNVLTRITLGCSENKGNRIVDNGFTLVNLAVKCSVAGSVTYFLPETAEKTLSAMVSAFSPDILIVPKPEDAWAVAIAAIVDKIISP